MGLTVGAGNGSISPDQNAGMEEATLITLDVGTHHVPAQSCGHLTEDLHRPPVPGLGEITRLAVGGWPPREAECRQDEEPGRGFSARESISERHGALHIAVEVAGHRAVLKGGRRDGLPGRRCTGVDGCAEVGQRPVEIWPATVDCAALVIVEPRRIDFCVQDRPGVGHGVRVVRGRRVRDAFARRLPDRCRPAIGDRDSGRRVRLRVIPIGRDHGQAVPRDQLLNRGDRRVRAHARTVRGLRDRSIGGADVGDDVRALEHGQSPRLPVGVVVADHHRNRAEFCLEHRVPGVAGSKPVDVRGIEPVLPVLADETVRAYQRSSVIGEAAGLVDFGDSDGHVAVVLSGDLSDSGRGNTGDRIHEREELIKIAVDVARERCFRQHDQACTLDRRLLDYGTGPIEVPVELEDLRVELNSRDSEGSLLGMSLGIHVRSRPTCRWLAESGGAMTVRASSGRR